MFYQIIGLWNSNIMRLLQQFFHLQKMRRHNVPSNYKIEKYCQLLNTSSANGALAWSKKLLGFSPIYCILLSFLISLNFDISSGFLNFLWKPISKNNLIKVKHEKVLWYIHLWVWSNGCGPPKEVTCTVWRPRFFQNI